MTIKKIVFIYSVLVLLSFIVCLLGYRYFFEIPNIKKKIEIIKHQEVVSIDVGLQNERSTLEMLTHDYAVWSSSYKFLTNKKLDNVFLEENFISDLYSSQKIDGVYFLDKNGETVWGKGFNSQTNTPLDFSAFINQFNNNDDLYPTVIKNEIPTTEGMFESQYGIAMFAAKQVRKSDRTGSNVGALVFIKLVRKDFFNSLEKLAQVKIDVKNYKNTIDIESELAKTDESTTYSFKIIKDYEGKPLLIFKIYHKVFEFPKLIDQSMLFAFILLILIPLLVTTILNKYLVEPILNIADSISTMSKDGHTQKLKLKPKTKEFTEMVSGFNALVETINQQKEELRKTVLIDELTGIANIRAYNSLIIKRWRQMQRSNTPLAIIMCDIDHFKKYNDSMGHQAGDNVIHTVAQALQSCMRREVDFLARYGGEEFIAILSSTNIDNLKTVMLSMKQAVDELKIPHNDSITSDYVTVSLGGAIIDTFTEETRKLSPDHLVSLADKSLYKAKNEGRNRLSIYTFNSASTIANSK